MVWNKISNYFTVLREISFLSIGNIIPTLIAAGFWFYIASLVGDEIYGEITYYLTIAGIASGVTMLGAPSSLNVYAAKGERILPIFSTIIFTISAIGAITVFFIFYNPGASLHVFSYVIFALITAEFLGRKLFKTYMKISIIQKILMVLFAILLYHLIGNDGIILGIAISFVPFGVLYIKEFRNNKLDFADLKPKRNFILNNYLLQFSRMFSASVDKIIIAPIFGFAILGNYALGMQFYMVFLIIPSIIFQYIVPQDASGNPSTVLKKITVLTSIGISILGIIFAPEIIKIMFPEFLEAVSIVQIVSLAVIPGTVNYMYISKFLGNLQNKIIVISSSIFLVSIISGMLMLGELYDVYGIAAAFVLASTFESIFLILASKFYKIQKE
ncbi:lipopolysaccharide biosynthesis protein [Nitrosopumilus adriaticus]|uniref:lipopolysaccharide biosynthesis protein n=1 Tax=Nitrosopumilus adriaticus TaxID=1580092 RepID=UPI00352F50B9